MRVVVTADMCDGKTIKRRDSELVESLLACL